MIPIARVRYLVAMGLVPPAGLAFFACARSASPDVVATPEATASALAATAPSATAPSASALAPERLATAPVDGGAAVERPEPAPPRASAADAGAATTAQTWEVAELEAPGTTSKPGVLTTAPLPRATCPSGQFCRHAPAKVDGGAPAPYGACEASATASSAPTRNVRFSAPLTARERAKTKDACCYTWFIPCPGGRPLREAGEIVVAPEIARDDWASRGAAQANDDASLDAATRIRLARHWSREATLEHASVASFSRFALQLLALGAPPELVASAHEAALDEVRHAQRCWGLATRYGGEARGPGALALPAGDLPVDPEIVASETLRDGCLGESLASRCAAEAASVARDPRVADVLRGIAEDEERHAELAWRTVAWLLARHPAPVRRAVEAFLASTAVRTTEVRVPERDDAGDEAHGVLGAQRLHDVQREVVVTVVVPCLEALLAYAPQADASPARGQEVTA